MKILYYNNCWFTNVGEAFIDFGAISILHKLFPDASIACVSEMTTLYSVYSHKTRNFELDDSHILENCYNPDGYFEADYLVFSGMFACKGFVDDCPAKLMADRMRRNGTKILFLGIGGSTYGQEEIQLCSRYFEMIKPELIVSRDNVTYENYKSVAECVKGIDCAYWINDVFNPVGFASKKYDVVTFNRTSEPDDFQNWEVPIIRPWYMQFDYKKEQFVNGRMISDTAYDYLTIYANANRVYTDLVHATIPSLAYQTPVKYYYVDKRSLAFETIEGLKDEDGWLSVSKEELDRQKKEIIYKISEKLSN